MTVRCTGCNKSHSFRNTRGNRLADHRCSECGGSLELLGGMHCLSGKHPSDDSKTHTSQFYQGEYFYADKNRKGEYYILHDGFFHKIENPVPAIIVTNSSQ